MASSSRVAFLRRVSVLSGLDDELLSRLSSEVTARTPRRPPSGAPISLIQLDVEVVGMLGWSQLEPIWEAGRAATQAALVANPDGLRGQVPEGPSPNGAVPADEGPRPGVGA